MPGENAIGFALFDAAEHIIEDWPTGGFRGAAFDICFADYKLVGFREFAKLGELVVNTSYLFVLGVGGLPGVQEVPVSGVGGLHEM